MKLTGLMTVRRGGKIYKYYRKRGAPLIALPDLPHDDPEFLAAYAEARRAAGMRERHPLGNLGALCLACEKLERFAGKSKGYQTILLRRFKTLVESDGNLSYRAIRDRHVQKDVRGASSPEDRRKAWRFIYAFALEADLVKTDPTIGVTVPDRPKTDGHPRGPTTRSRPSGSGGRSERRSVSRSSCYSGPAHGSATACSSGPEWSTARECSPFVR